jgi:hypothetical protein
MLRSASRTVSTLALLGLSTLAPIGCAEGTGEDIWWAQGTGGGPGHIIFTGTASTMILTSSSSSSSSSSGGHVNSSSSSTSSSSGGGTCDSSNDCNTCGNCAVSTVCAAAMNACAADQACNALLDCLSACTDQTCANNCAAQNPGGQQTYMAAMTCVLCQACPVSCAAGPMCGP